MFLESGKILDNIVIITQNSFDLAQGRARHNKLHITGNALDGLAAYRQAVAVNGHDVQTAAFDFKQAAGMDGLGFVVRNRENGLRDHALENGLRQRKTLVAGHISQSRILVGLAAIRLNTERPHLMVVISLSSVSR